MNELLYLSLKSGEREQDFVRSAEIGGGGVRWFTMRDGLGGGGMEIFSKEESRLS